MSIGAVHPGTPRRGHDRTRQHPATPAPHRQSRRPLSVRVHIVLSAASWVWIESLINSGAIGAVNWQYGSHQDLRRDNARRRPPGGRGSGPMPIGLNFYPQSPRFVTPVQAAAIVRALPGVHGRLLGSSSACRCGRCARSRTNSVCAVVQILRRSSRRTTTLSLRPSSPRFG